MARSFLAVGTPRGGGRAAAVAAARPGGRARRDWACSTGPSWARPSWPRHSARSARPGVVLIDDAELLRDCGAAGELSRLIALGGDTGRALVLGGDAESIGVGFTGWQVEAKRARRGCLTAPATLPEGDLIGRAAVP